MTDDMEHCFICGRPFPQIHHMMNKYDKKKAEKFGLVLPLCMMHHTGCEGVHSKPEKMLAMRQMAQKKFEEKYGHEAWMKEFGKDYL